MRPGGVCHGPTSSGQSLARFLFAVDTCWAPSKKGVNDMICVDSIGLADLSGNKSCLT